MPEITPDQFEQEAERILKQILNIKGDLQELGANNAKGLLFRRVFNKGGSKNASGSGLGGYSAKYKEVRAKAGRQTGVVDLQKTDRLKNSIQVGRGGNSTVLGFLPGKRAGEKINNAQLAQRLEGRYGEIFSINQAEDKKIERSILAYINKTIKL